MNHSVSIQESGSSFAKIILTNAEYTFGVLLQNHLQNYESDLGKVLMCGLEQFRSETDNTATLQVHVEWNEEYEKHPKRFNFLLTRIFQNIKGTYVTLRAQFKQQSSKLEENGTK